MIYQKLKERLLLEDAGSLDPTLLYFHIVDAVSPFIPVVECSGEKIHPLRILEYGHRSSFAEWKKVKDIPGIDNWIRVKSNLCTGDSEGIYLDVSLETRSKENERVLTPLFIFKTLEEGPDAYGVMGALSGMILCATETFLAVNEI